MQQPLRCDAFIIYFGYQENALAKTISAPTTSFGPTLGARLRRSSGERWRQGLPLRSSTQRRVGAV